MNILISTGNRVLDEAIKSQFLFRIHHYSEVLVLEWLSWLNKYCFWCLSTRWHRHSQSHLYRWRAFVKIYTRPNINNKSSDISPYIRTPFDSVRIHLNKRNILVIRLGINRDIVNKVGSTTENRVFSKY